MNTIKTPVIIDMTDAVIELYDCKYHVIRDADGATIALCPLADDVLPNGQFSYAPDIQRAVNSHAELLAFVKKRANFDSVFAKGSEKDRIKLAIELVAKAEGK